MSNPTPAPKESGASSLQTVNRRTWKVSTTHISPYVQKVLGLDSADPAPSGEALTAQ